MQEQVYHTPGRESRTLPASGSKQPPLEKVLQAYFSKDKGNVPAVSCAKPIQRLVVCDYPSELRVPTSWLNEPYDKDPDKIPSKLIKGGKFMQEYNSDPYFNRFKDLWGINGGTQVVESDNTAPNWQYINVNHTLYTDDGVTPVGGISMPVYHPFAYVKEESDVDKVWSNDLKKYACVLISMIYERALASGTDNRIENLRALLLSYKATMPGRLKFKPDNLPDNDSLYALVEALHTALHGTEDKEYDLSYVNERVWQKEYDLVAAPNCGLEALPATVVLEQGAVYLFQVGNVPPGEATLPGRGKAAVTSPGKGKKTVPVPSPVTRPLSGHATTVKMKLRFQGPFLPAAKVTDYFEVYNETAFNFNQTTLDRATVIGGIWKKK